MPDNQTPDPEEKDTPVLDFLADLLAAALMAGILFGGFHLFLFLFSLVYKLSVHFHYLP